MYDMSSMDWDHLWTYLPPARTSPGPPELCTHLPVYAACAPGMMIKLAGLVAADSAGDTWTPNHTQGPCYLTWAFSSPRHVITDAP
jgi:hypothetical protein